MSTAAHEPRRVGPRRTESASGSKVTPRRNARETSELNGLQYDSDELPVLIRLPNLRDLGSVEKPPASRTHKKRPPVERTSAGKQKTSKHNPTTTSKKPTPPPQASYNKLIFGGIVGGVLVVLLLLLFKSSSPTPPTDQDGWASEAADLETLVQEPDFSFASESEPPSLYPGFADQAPETETAQFASGEFENAPIGVPYYDELQVTRQSETATFPSEHRPVASWPSEETMGLQSPSGSTSADLWPSESLSQEQGGYNYPPTDSPSQTDYRSSMYPSETESFRMGKLDADRPLATESDRSSILDGIIETPDTRSLR